MFSEGSLYSIENYGIYSFLETFDDTYVFRDTKSSKELYFHFSVINSIGIIPEKLEVKSKKKIKVRKSDLPKNKIKNTKYLVPLHLRWFIGNLFKWQYLKCGRYKNGRLVIINIDHIIPKSWEANDSLDNLQTLCWSCNRKKFNYYAVDYRLEPFKEFYESENTDLPNIIEIAKLRLSEK